MTPKRYTHWMLGWFDTKEADALAQWVVDELCNRLSP